MPRIALRERIAQRIQEASEDVFLTREFKDLSDEDQVLRALRELVRQKRLVRLGYGVYGKAFRSRLTGNAILNSKGGFLDAAAQTLDKLGVPWEPTAAQRAYNEGRSTQVPVNPMLRIKGRFSRKLSIGGVELQRER